MVAELSLDRGENFGLFVRGSLLYDDLVEDSETARTPISEAGKDLAGSYVRLLDAFVYGRWDVGGHLLDVRAGTPGRELGREHLHPGRHQRRHQSFRRLGAARAGLGTARSLPAAGNAEGRLRPHRQRDGGGHRPVRLGPHRAGAGRHLLLEQRFRSARRRGSLPRLRRVLGPGHGLHVARRAVHREFPGRAARADDRALGLGPVRHVAALVPAGFRAGHRVRLLLRQLSQQAAAHQRPHRHARPASPTRSAR